MKYEIDNNIATLTFDDGKANVVGVTFLEEINACLDRAEEEQVAAVILRGREGMFSAGFDLKEFEKGVEEGLSMVRQGFELLIRLYSFPLPLVAACTGHGIAMGAFMMMSCDMRIATRGDFKMSLPETRISMDLPPILLELTRSRISRRHMTRVALLSEVYNPEQAIDAGFVDEVVDASELTARSMAVAAELAQLPQQQFAANKLAIRGNSLQVMKDYLANNGRGSPRVSTS
ncbi:crotonase/enoyl-CoA hydratase family protein [Seongchinamella unica]|uniref:Crotonase/enoyl-CoA hydratase family protein n=1 Tax=Seongchinamella unica TaxID=2547392 RepID=A0A4R5LN76_9GAMM|nr:crotonase/enoyl-CoA hydratase family protein [Seongchinamella unica]TDG11667.1 crotonase/enoyl-CoA hydratase family protein [Seongchinamella unica]